MFKLIVCAYNGLDSVPVVTKLNRVENMQFDRETASFMKIIKIVWYLPQKGDGM